MASKSPQTNASGLDESTHRDADSEIACLDPSTSGSSPVHELQMQQGQSDIVSVVAERQSEPVGISSRILVVGSNLLAGALASALETHGFATKHIVPREAEIDDGIEWRPNLVLIDVRLLDVTFGSVLIGQFSRERLPVCVIDTADDDFRLRSWVKSGSSALIDRSEPFDQLFETINRFLEMGALPATSRSGQLGATFGAKRQQEPSLERFAILTERERVVLAELMEGHCAEEIASAAFVSISTVRSQIKAILHKLGVNSQLAAVALARRAGWSLDTPPGNRPNSLGRRPSPRGVA